jgi:lysophospholipase L1-like esterase
MWCDAPSTLELHDSSVDDRPSVDPTKLCILLGDSNVAAYPDLGLPGLDQFIAVQTVNLAVVGASINSQRLRFIQSEYSHNPNVRWVVIQLGINNVFEPNFSTQYNIQLMQSLVLDIENSNPNAVILLSNVLPARRRMEIVSPEDSGDSILLKYLDFNTSLSGNGSNPVVLHNRGYRITNTEEFLASPGHYLRYSLDDGIHTTIEGRRVNADLINRTIEETVQ